MKKYVLVMVITGLAVLPLFIFSWGVEGSDANSMVQSQLTNGYTAVFTPTEFIYLPAIRNPEPPPLSPCPRPLKKTYFVMGAMSI